MVVAFGDGIIEADYANFADPESDAVFLVKTIEDPRRFGVAVLNDAGNVTELIEKPPTKEHKLAIAGINWFRNGRQLFQAIETIIEEGRQTLGEYFMVDSYQVLLEKGGEDTDAGIESMGRCRHASSHFEHQCAAFVGWLCE